MKLNQLFVLSLRFLKRDARSGEISILAVALVIAVASTTTIGLFTDRLGRAMTLQSAELLGADLVLASPTAIDPDWLQEAGTLGLQTTTGMTFPSVLVQGENFHLASIRAVTAQFPLRGKVRIADTPFGVERVARKMPAAGEIWLASDLFADLDIKPGDSLMLGNKRLRVTRAVGEMPGRGGTMMAIAPRVVVSIEDIKAAGVVLPGSRVTYYALFAGELDTISRFEKIVKSKLNANQRLAGVKEGRPAIASALEKAEQFLSLAVLATIILSGVAVAMAAGRYSQRHFDVSALLRCYGVKQHDILSLYIFQFIQLGVLASGAGILLGLISQELIILIVKDLMPGNLPRPGFGSIALGGATGMLLLLGFSLPPIINLKHVPPLRVLRRQMNPGSVKTSSVYGLAIAAIALLSWQYLGEARLMAFAIGGGILAIAILAALNQVLMRFFLTVFSDMPLYKRMGLNMISRQRMRATSQILAFGITFMVIITVALLRTSLIDSWRSQLPDDAPNYFAINLQPQEVNEAQQFMRSNAIQYNTLYPVVRGRLTHINELPMTQTVSKEAQSNNALHRELNLTWSDQLQADNDIIAGRWWQDSDRTKARVSVESRLAKNLGINIGDSLRFSIAGQELNAQVLSLRKVQWESFRPNFYMVFSPGALDGFAATYMTSFYIPMEQRTILRDFMKRFPATTLIDIDRIIFQVRRIIQRVTLAIEYVLVFILLAGMVVFAAALQASLDERLYDGAVMRALGATRKQLRASHIIEFGVLGLLSGLLALLGVELISYMLYTRIYHIDYIFVWWRWVFIPLAILLWVVIAGLWGTRRVARIHPGIMLRGDA